jgi:hypothetical protein
MQETVASAVKSGLYVVEDNLNMIMRMFVRPNQRSIMRATRDDIHSAVKSRMLAIIDSMFGEIAYLKKTFNLKTDQDSATWRVHSHVSAIWAILEDCRPDKLKGYGSLTQQETDTLSRHIGALLQMNDQLLEELRTGTPTDDPQAMP